MTIKHALVFRLAKRISSRQFEADVPWQQSGWCKLMIMNEIRNYQAHCMTNSAFSCCTKRQLIIIDNENGNNQ